MQCWAVSCRHAPAAAAPCPGRAPAWRAPRRRTAPWQARPGIRPRCCAPPGRPASCPCPGPSAPGTPARPPPRHRNPVPQQNFCLITLALAKEMQVCCPTDSSNPCLLLTPTNSWHAKAPHLRSHSSCDCTGWQRPGLNLRLKPSSPVTCRSAKVALMTECSKWNAWAAACWNNAYLSWRKGVYLFTGRLFAAGVLAAPEGAHQVQARHVGFRAGRPLWQCAQLQYIVGGCRAFTRPWRPTCAAARPAQMTMNVWHMACTLQ